MTWILPVLLGGGVCYILKWIWDRRTVHSTWEKLGINGPKASSLFFGNTLEIMSQGRYNLLENWTRKYGKVFGAYEVDLPVLHVADPDLVQEVLQKQHEKFHQRRALFDNSHDKYVDLVEAVGERWRRVRTVSSPTFTPQTMEDLSSAVEKSVKKLMIGFENLANEKQTGFNIQEVFRLYALDVCATTVYGLEVDIINEQNTLFYQESAKFLQSLAPKSMAVSTRIMFLSFLLFPGLIKIARFFSPRITSFRNDWFLDLAKTLILKRQESGEVQNDYIQLALELLRKEKDETSDGSSTATESISMEELQPVVADFLTGGYEPAANSLTFAAYYLALYPNIQAKLQREIDQHFPVKNENIGFDAVQKLPYLEMVFCEVSRLLYVGMFALQRICNETTKLRDDITVPNGAKVYVNVADLHMNPDLWGPEPTHEFVPDRFLPERKAKRHPMALLTFGAGPRYCIGKHFGIMNVKMALVKMLQTYTVIKCDETQIPLKIVPDGIRGPLEGVFVALKKRQ